MPTTDITRIPGIGPATAVLLADHGFATADDVASATPAQLSSVRGFADARAAAVIGEARKLLAEDAGASAPIADKKAKKKETGKGGKAKGKKDKKTKKGKKGKKDKKDKKDKKGKKPKKGKKAGKGKGSKGGKKKGKKKGQKT